MVTWLSSDDLDLLAAAQRLATLGLAEAEIATQLGLEPAELQARLWRIRRAFESLHRLAALVTGEGSPGSCHAWKIVMDETRRAAPPAPVLARP